MTLSSLTTPSSPMSMWDYLLERAKFYSPETLRSHDSSNIIDHIKEIERSRVTPDKRPRYAFHDDQMVDTLIDKVREFLKDIPITASQQSDLDRDFQPIVDRNGTHTNWSKNKSENDAASFIRNGAHVAIWETIRVLGLAFDFEDRYSPPDCQSKVNYRFSTVNGRGILVEVKAPIILDLLTTVFEQSHNRLTYKSTEILVDRVLSQLYIHMYLSGACWAALTSHHKWVFLRRLENPVALVYSAVELQENNTRPFLALLAMMLAAEGIITIPPPTEELFALNDIEQSQSDVEASREDSFFPSDNVKEYISNHLQIRWSPNVTPNGEKLIFSAVFETEQRSLLGDQPIRLQLKRLLGSGSTGAVYEATLDVDEFKLTDKSDITLAFAIKTVPKDRSQKGKGQLERLRDEFEIYKKVEEARKTGLIGKSIVRCYGLYESDNTLVLLLEYGGQQVKSWEEVSLKDRQDLYKSIELLHRIGVFHGDIMPQNVVKGQDGVYKLIDFSLSAMHKCPERHSVSQRSIRGKSRKRCLELDDAREQLLR